MKKLSGISVFFPAYNDAQALPELIKKTYKVLPEVARSYNVIVVNDGSTDNTAAAVKDLMKRYKTLSLVTHKKNKGYGGALQTGFNKADKEWVFYTDGDGQYDPQFLKALVCKVQRGITAVNGIKLNRGDGLFRAVTGFVYNLILHRLYQLPIADVDCDFRLIKKSLIKNIELSSNSGVICLELILKLHKAGARFAEVGVPHYKRQYGRSQFFRPSHLLKTLRDNIVFYQMWRKKVVPSGGIEPPTNRL